jgi:hypothetical protein
MHVRTSACLTVLLATLLFSCVSQKKLVSTQTQLTRQDSILLTYSARLTELNTKRQEKQDRNQLDDTANTRIAEFIRQANNEIAQMHRENTVLIGEVEIDKSDWDKLRKNLSACLNATKRINGKILFLTDLINRNTVLRLDQDVLFEPGKYLVEQSVVEMIGRLFEPVARQIDSFTQKYPDFPLSLAITAKGYADATNISEGSSLYKDLKEQILFTGQPLNRENLNKALSNLRAKTVIELFQQYTKSRRTGNIIFIYKGKGEEFPDPAISDYRTDDPRRRIVLLYWSVFPDY